MITMKERIKLMQDYCSWPLWGMASDNIGNINPEILPLSQETINRLKAYADDYDAALNWDDPANTPVATEAEISASEIEGIRLWMQLQKELKESYEVFYFSHRLRTLVSDIKELDPKDVMAVFPNLKGSQSL